MSTGADPARLARYQRIGSDLDASLARVALQLDGLAPGEPRIGPIAAEVARFAGDERSTGSWVGSVGRALAAADEGPAPVSVRSASLGAVADLATAVGPGATVRALRRLIRSGASPAVVASAMADVPAAVWAPLVRDDPELVGPIDGMPPDQRYRANRVLLERAVADEADPDRRRALRHLLEPDPGSGRPRQFLLVDPAGDGRVVEVFGRLDAARSVAVVVPGVGTDLFHYQHGLADRAAALHDAADRMSGPGSTAVVAWLGYDPPDDPTADPRSFAALGSVAPARRGGRALTSAIAGFRLRPDQRLVLVGHSYGSTTVAAALQAGVRPSAVAVAGSPGVLVHHASEFGLPDTRFLTLEAPGDVITRTPAFGPDPNRMGSGFTRLETGGSGHSAYFTPRSPSLHNLAAVVANRPDRLLRRAPAPSESAALALDEAGGEAAAEIRRLGRPSGLLPRSPALTGAAEIGAEATEVVVHEVVVGGAAVIDDITTVARALHWH